MTKKNQNRRGMKAAIVREYLDEHGFTTPEDLAVQCSVSVSYAGKQLRIWKLKTKNWEAQPEKTEKRSQGWREILKVEPTAAVSDGSTASYYELPARATELQDLISHKNMNAQIGEIFRAAYRYGASSHSDELRDAKKIKFYIDAEIKRLESL
jgi:arginine/lysine/ornithine decarboxylase